MFAIVELVQEYGPLFGILAAVGSVLGVAFTFYKAAHDRQVKTLQRRNDELQDENERLRREGTESLRPLVGQLQSDLEQDKRVLAKSAADAATAEAGWQSKLHSAELALSKQHETAQALTAELEKA